jgi:transketolase
MPEDVTQMAVERSNQTPAELAAHCVAVREAIMQSAAICGSGHYGPSFSCVEILVSLYYQFMRLNSSEPSWADRDRFVLSKGHACSTLYPILADLGFFPKEELRTFTRLGSRLGDHPDMRKVPGVDFSAGALGHGLSIALGMALAARLDESNRRCVALLGDGELNEGQIWEAAAYAGANKISNLLAIVDANKVCVDGATEAVLDMEPIDAKWRAFGWHAERVDGHSLSQLLDHYADFERRRAEGGPPTVLIADTISGKGVDFIEGKAEWHIGFLGGVDVERALESIRRTQSAH